MALFKITRHTKRRLKEIGLEKSQCHSSLQKRQEGGPREPQASQPSPGKVMEQLILEVIIKQVEEKKVVNMDSLKGNHA